LASAVKVPASHTSVPFAPSRAVIDDHPSAAVLERLTIVSARPDSVVYVRADYAPAVSAFDDSVIAVVPQRSTSTPQSRASAADALDETGNPGSRVSVLRAASGTVAGMDTNPRPARRAGGLSAYLRPAEQYALTQRMADLPPAPARIDVRA
jgi:hypothetical protein